MSVGGCTRHEDVDIADLLARPTSREALDFFGHCESCDACADAVRLFESRAPAMGREGTAPPVVMLVVAIFTLVVAAASIYLLRSAPVPEPPQGAADAAAPPGATPDEARREGAQGEHARIDGAPGSVDHVTMVVGQDIEVPLAALAKDRPLLATVILPVASTSDDPRPVRVLSAHQGYIETEGRVAEGTRRSVDVEIPAGWLTPGRYIIEVKTTEQSALPLRRYQLFVLD